MEPEKVTRSPRARNISTAGTGTDETGEMRRKRLLAGNNPSRDMAYTSREPEAMMIRPQAKTETITSPKKASDIVLPSFDSMISGSG